MPIFSDSHLVVGRGSVAPMPTLDAALLERLTREIFVARGVPEDDAAWIASMLVRANLRGHDSHGVIRIPQYVASLQRGTLNPKPQLRLVVDTPTIAILDGDGGFGQVVARRGIALAIERARAQGLAAVALRGANHVRRLGTNPHAIGIPGPDGGVAMSHDFATSVWAEGKLRVKFNRGETVPPGIMLDGRGEPSTDPREYYTEPAGSLLTAGGHKGFGLSVAVEILAGILSGAGAASGEPSVFRNGTLIVCIDPARFLPLPEFHAQVAALMDWVRSAPLAAGENEILIPGEPEARVERERRAAGVPIEDETWRQIREVAEEVGVHA